MNTEQLYKYETLVVLDYIRLYIIMAVLRKEEILYLNSF